MIGARGRIFLALLAIGLAGPAAALGVALPQIPGFHIGYQKQVGRQVVVELVPQGETVERFTRMITLQTAPGLATVPTATFIAQFAKRYQARCPGSTARVVPLGKGLAGIRIDCSRHPATGQPETVFARALAAGPDMAIVQITTKYLTMPPEAQWARAYLGSVTVR